MKRTTLSALIAGALALVIGVQSAQAYTRTSVNRSANVNGAGGSANVNRNANVNRDVNGGSANVNRKARM